MKQHSPTPQSPCMADIAKAMELRQQVREYRKLINFIDYEILKGSIELIEGTKARANAVLALSKAEEVYFDFIHNVK